MNEREDVNENLWFDYLLAGERRRARASLAAFNDPTFETIPALLLYLDGRYRESLPALLKRAPPELPYAVYETFYIGTVYLELAKPDSAREWFEKVTAVSHDIRRSIFLDGRTRHPALRRLCELADTPVRKQQSCGAIVEEWKDADPFLQPIVARAKARLAE